MKFFEKIFAFATIVMLIQSNSSCKLFNPDEDIPSYIRIDSFMLTTNTNQGANTHKIIDAWIYIDEEPFGVFELPVVFPVLEQGNHSIIVFPGIAVNGILSFRLPYPFYKTDTTTLNLVRKDTVTFNPTTSYFSSGFQFSFIEDFESGNIFSPTSNADTSLQRISISGEPAVYGSHVGSIFVSDAQPTCEVATIDDYILPMANFDVYLEMDYQCNQPFSIGLRGNIAGQQDQEFYKVTLNEKDEWNKIYVQLNNEVTSMGADNYQILIRADQDSSTTPCKIWIDNMKLIYLDI